MKGRYDTEIGNQRKIFKIFEYISKQNKSAV